MQPVDTIEITPPSRNQLAQPAELLMWARETFAAHVGSGRDPAQVVEALKRSMVRLGVPERLLVRCRVSREQEADIVITWQDFTPRQHTDEDTGVTSWYLHMPARPLESTQTT